MTPLAGDYGLRTLAIARCRSDRLVQQLATLAEHDKVIGSLLVISDNVELRSAVVLSSRT